MQILYCKTCSKGKIQLVVHKYLPKKQLKTVLQSTDKTCVEEKFSICSPNHKHLKQKNKKKFLIELSHKG